MQRRMARLMRNGTTCVLLLVVVVSILIILKTNNSPSSPLRNPTSQQTLKMMNTTSTVPPPPPKQTTCRDRICSEFLTDADVPHWKYCWKKTRLLDEPARSMCRFVNGTGRYPVALASFPGSGNTWSRGLLQGITGLCTGAIYCDTTLRKEGFPGESLRSGINLVVKTHQTDPRWSGVTYSPSAPFKYFKRLRDVPVYSGAIFIVRNPFDALVSEWHREQTESSPNNHVSFVGMEHFRENEQWDIYVRNMSVEWKDTIEGWLLKNKGHPVIVVRYEDLKKNTVFEVTRMLDFLQVPYTKEKVMEVVGGGFGEFQRQHHKPSSLQYYTQRQKELVDNVLQTTRALLASRRLLRVCDITEYLRTQQ